MSLVYLGPEGSYTHRAAQKLAPPGQDLISKSSLVDVLNLIESGGADYAVAALYNSSAGPINKTCQAVVSGSLSIISDTSIKVTFDLYRRIGDDTEIQIIYGHEKALAQIGHWLEVNPVKRVEVESSTLGLEMLRDGLGNGEAAVGPPDLGDKFSIQSVSSKIEGDVVLETVFVLLHKSCESISADERYIVRELGGVKSLDPLIYEDGRKGLFKVR